MDLDKFSHAIVSIFTAECNVIEWLDKKLGTPFTILLTLGLAAAIPYYFPQWLTWLIAFVLIVPFLSSVFAMAFCTWAKSRDR